MNITKEQIKEWMDSSGIKFVNPYDLAEAMEQCFSDLAPKWVSVDGYKNLPKGVWLVKLEGDDIPEVADNTGTICIIGNRFAFDAERITSYMPLPATPK
jgi:hypothetical protein